MVTLLWIGIYHSGIQIPAYLFPGSLRLLDVAYVPLRLELGTCFGGGGTGICYDIAVLVFLDSDLVERTRV